MSSTQAVLWRLEPPSRAPRGGSRTSRSIPSTHSIPRPGVIYNGDINHIISSLTIAVSLPLKTLCMPWHKNTGQNRATFSMFDGSLCNRCYYLTTMSFAYVEVSSQLTYPQSPLPITKGLCYIGTNYVPQATKIHNDDNIQQPVMEDKLSFAKMSFNATTLYPHDHGCLKTIVSSIALIMIFGLKTVQQPDTCTDNF